MGNKVLKILLPLIVLGVIVLVVIRTQYKIDNIAPTEVAPFNFNTYVNELIQTDLHGQPYDKAKEGYRLIYDVIKTEEGVMATDSMETHWQLLSNDTILSCYKMTFDAFWPIYQSFVEAVFKSNDWSNKTDKLDEIKNEAESLSQRKGTSERNDSIMHYKGYVNNYYSALGFVNGNITCTSSTDFNNLVVKKDGFKKYPLNNYTDFVKKLDDIPKRAKVAWEKHVKNKVDDACAQINLDEFLNKKIVCEAKITDYQSKFYGELEKEEQRLKDRWKELLQLMVNEACRINDITTFSDNYSIWTKKIDDYGGGLNFLKEQLVNHYNQLRNANTNSNYNY